MSYEFKQNKDLSVRYLLFRVDSGAEKRQKENPTSSQRADACDVGTSFINMEGNLTILVALDQNNFRDKHIKLTERV